MRKFWQNNAAVLKCQRGPPLERTQVCVYTKDYLQEAGSRPDAIGMYILFICKIFFQKLPIEYTAIIDNIPMHLIQSKRNLDHFAWKNTISVWPTIKACSIWAYKNKLPFFQLPLFKHNTGSISVKCVNAYHKRSNAWLPRRVKSLVCQVAKWV